MRSYIFRKVSGKFAAIWRGIKTRKEAEKKKMAEKMAMEALMRLTEEKAKEKQEATKPREGGGRNSMMRPGVRPKLRTGGGGGPSPTKPREEVRPSEAEQLIQEILMGVIR